MIRVKDIAYVRLRAPDLDVAERFLTDFGLARSARTDTALYMRPSGPSHHAHVTELGPPGFVGFAFEAYSLDDLKTLSSAEAAGAVEAIGEPGGGHRVRVADPDGFAVEVVHGIEAVPERPAALSDAYNWGRERARFGETKRLAPGPARVTRLGHVVFSTTDFARSDAFYKAHFGMISSDEVYPDARPDHTMMAFSRVDGGDEFVDHHTLAVMEGEDAAFHHAAFEVENIDAVVLGHEHLRDKGYDHALGIGRHVLGSQVFDYWLDPWGRRHEHWTDGDLLNRASGTGRQPLSRAMGRQWGPTVPEHRS
ncbi:MAG: VOC family protein [Bauldia litoralis]